MYDADVISAAQAVLDLLSGEVDEASIPGHSELNEALDPIRRVAPVRVRCRRAHRQATICWAAVTPSQALVVTAKRRRLAKDSLGYGGGGDLIHEPAHPADGLAWWIRDAQDPAGYITVSANPSVASGWPLRYTLHCRTCHLEHPLTNSRMLHLLAFAVTTGRGEIWL